jgi:hypothetical protein
LQEKVAKLACIGCRNFRHTEFSFQAEIITMTKNGKRLIASAKEALAIAEGKADPTTYKVHVLKAPANKKNISKNVRTGS